ncbi:dihydrolipoamide dehydrogenase [Chitinophaga skermanii]|uniref:Dihydrolipoyl dehydrogenase n=1 Tax=Chitinophaga skermanii TaxID=331697 RepID=A0A327R4L5_9BACT|nr:dihydrolipoyl dehydrogenase [Chitinophaga skermanii]RAJ10882.1 dihydrolipoamide dehydrogenase [Chitinophaga skermanii]
MAQSFDIIVIGSGPGGYTAAIRAAQLGYKTAIVEKYAVLGGTCTNVGCIPTKALLDGTELYDMIQHKTEKQGIGYKDLSLDFTKLISRKATVVKQNNDGITYLMKKNKIAVLQGLGSFTSKNEIKVTSEGKEEKYTAKYFIIATGSKPSTIPGVEIDKQRIITSTEALSLKEQPKSVIIIGGGVIGVEMASIYQRIGTKVTIVEYADHLIPTMDHELGKELFKLLTKKGIDIFLNCKVQSAKNTGSGASVSYLDEKGAQQTATGDYVLVAVGRKAYTEGLGLDKTGIKTDNRGRIETNEKLQTAEPNIYAIGDVIKGAMLAHKAEDEAVFVVDSIHGLKAHVNYHAIPGVVYTWPEVASVGYTEEELKASNTPYNKGKFPFTANGKARAADDTDGFAKVLTDPKYGEVLGVHIIGARAADMIAQGVYAIEFELTDTEIAKSPYAHPTFSEALKEAFLGASGRGQLNI